MNAASLLRIKSYGYFDIPLVGWMSWFYLRVYLSREQEFRPLFLTGRSRNRKQPS